jgi:hypothetical protein
LGFSESSKFSFGEISRKGKLSRNGLESGSMSSLIIMSLKIEEDEEI